MSLLRQFVQTVIIKAPTKPTASAPDGVDSPDKPGRKPGLGSSSAPATLQSIAINPPDAKIVAGAQQQFRATGVYADGSTRDITNTVAWWCNDLEVISIDDASGLATAQAKAGPAEIAATDGDTNITGSAKVTVTAAGAEQSKTPVLQSIRIDPDNVRLVAGAQQQYRATGVYADGSTRDITNTVAWWCNDLEVISIDDTSGLATAQAKAGLAEIAATDGDANITGSAKVTVAAPAATQPPQPGDPQALKTIVVGPDNVALDFEQHVQLQATGVYYDGTERDLSASVVWTSKNDKVIAIDPKTGLAWAHSEVGDALVGAQDKATGIAGFTKVIVKPHVGRLRKAFSRRLTSAERKEAETVYQDSIDYDKVEIVCGGIFTIGGVKGDKPPIARTVGNKICLTPSDFKEKSTDLMPTGLETLIHELGHVWQFQHGGIAYIPSALSAQHKASKQTGDRNAAYDWRQALKAHLPWEEWNAEQQAQAATDYYDAEKRLEAGLPTPSNQPQPDKDTVKDLEPYIAKIRAGEGGPGNRGKK